MTTQRIAHLTVRAFDVDGWNEVPPAGLAAYLEQTAREASDALGFGEAWYRERGTAWVVRRLTLARTAALPFPGACTVTTWVSNVRRVRCSRNYEVRDAAGRPVAAAIADWVYVDRVRGAPIAIRPDLLEWLAPGPSLALPPEPEGMASAASGPVFTQRRHAERHEADSIGHINNTVYLTWLDEALAAAVAAAGLPLTPVGGPGLRLWGARYTVDFLQSARPGDALLLRSRVTRTAGADLLGWEQTITREDDGTELVHAATWQVPIGLEAAGLTADAARAALLAPHGPAGGEIDADH